MFSFLNFEVLVWGFLVVNIQKSGFYGTIGDINVNTELL